MLYEKLKFIRHAENIRGRVQLLYNFMDSYEDKEIVADIINQLEALVKYLSLEIETNDNEYRSAIHNRCS